MMTKYLLLCLLFIVPGSRYVTENASAEETDETRIPDSLLVDRTIRNISTAFPDSALHLLDAAESRHLPKLLPYRINLLRGMVYETKKQYALKETYCRRALESDSIHRQPGQKLQALCLLTSALASQGKYEESIRTALQGITLARELKNKVVEWSLFISMAQTCFNMKDLEKGVGYIEQVIDLAEHSDNVRELAQLSDAYGELIAALASEKQYEKAIGACLKRKKIIERMSSLPGPPRGYIDQQYTYLYSKLAVYYQNTGQAGAAIDNYNKFLATRYAQTLQGMSEGLPYLLQAGQYQQVLKINIQNHALFQGQDTLNYNYLNLLQCDAAAYRGLGDYRRADDLNQRIALVTDSIYMREKKSRAEELSVIFQLNEKEMRLQEAEATANRRHILFLAACGIGIALGVLLWNKHINLRKTRQRNRIAARQIDELLAQKEELRKAFDERITLPVAGNHNGDNETNQIAEAQNAGIPAEIQGNTCIDDIKDYARFIRMENVIVKHKLFLRPGFGRDELVQLTHLDKNQIGKLLQEHVKMNLSDYLNRLRVEYSVAIMKEKSYLSIDGIAQEAGFNSRSTFYTAFSKAFDMTPIQYMKTLQ